MTELTFKRSQSSKCLWQIFLGNFKTKGKTYLDITTTLNEFESSLIFLKYLPKDIYIYVIYILSMATRLP